MARVFFLSPSRPLSFFFFGVCWQCWLLVRTAYQIKSLSAMRHAPRDFFFLGRKARADVWECFYKILPKRRKNEKEMEAALAS